jgi:hypothetical protein
MPHQMGGLHTREVAGSKPAAPIRENWPAERVLIVLMG